VISALAANTYQPAPLSILVLIGAGDAKNCCAANYERTVFKDRTVVGLASQHFVTLRLDRDQAGSDLHQRLGLRTGAPALVVLDAAGGVAARWQECVNARDVVRVMRSVLKVSKKQAKAAADMTRRFAGVEAHLDAERWLEASRELSRLQDLRYAPERGKAQATQMLEALARTGRERMLEAQADPELASRYDSLLTLRRGLLLIPGLIEDLRAAVGEIEADEANAEVVGRVRGQRLLDEARQLLENGSRNMGRGLLRKVRRDYAGTPAAEQAAELLKP